MPLACERTIIETISILFEHKLAEESRQQIGSSAKRPRRVVLRSLSSNSRARGALRETCTSINDFTTIKNQVQREVLAETSRWKLTLSKN
jgi:hypothetical protein